MKNLESILKERKRCRERNKRLGYSKKYKISPEYRKKAKLRYQNKYPEKTEAHKTCRHISKPDGKQIHHWSYNEKHFTDVIFVCKELHDKIHNYMLYDQNHKMYRTIGNVLLDTKEKHIKYIYIISSLKHDQILKIFLR